MIRLLEELVLAPCTDSLRREFISRLDRALNGATLGYGVHCISLVIFHNNSARVPPPTERFVR